MTQINALPPGAGLDPGLAPNFIGQGLDGAPRRYAAADIVKLGAVLADLASAATLTAAVSSEAQQRVSGDAATTALVTALQTLISALQAGRFPQGAYNGATGLPSLATVGAAGDYWEVNVAGTISIPGYSGPVVPGDQLVSTGTAWYRVALGGTYLSALNPQASGALSIGTSQVAQAGGAGLTVTDPGGVVLGGFAGDGSVYSAGLSAKIAGLTFAYQTGLKPGQVVLTDPGGVVLSSLGIGSGAAASGAASPNGSSATSYSPSDIATRNAAALARSMAVRDRGNTTMQLANAPYNAVPWGGQSEFEGIEAQPALPVPGSNCLMVGQSPRPQNLTAGGTFTPVIDSAFHTLVSVNQNNGNGNVLVTPKAGGFSGLSNVVFSGSTVTVSGSTGTLEQYSGGNLTSTPVGAAGQPPLNLTQIFSAGMYIAFGGAGLAGSYAPMTSGATGLQFTIAAVTAGSITVNQPIPAGVPVNPVGPVSLYATNNNANACGEEPGVSAVNFWDYLRTRRLGAATTAAQKLVLGNVAVTGTSITQWQKSASAGLYGRFVSFAQTVIANAGAGNVVVPCIPWGQGGTDSTNGMTYATYQSDEVAMVTSLRADIMAATGQAYPPAFVTFQLSGGGGTDELNIAQAQLDLALNPPFPDWYMVGPGYPYPDNGFHYTPNGSRNFGLKFGEVLHKIFERGEGWLPLHPINITARGNQILVDFHVPEPPLANDIAYLNTTATSYADWGFGASDAVGGLGITSVAFPTLPEGSLADACILITCDRNITLPGTLTYADGPNHNGTGNLRDSNPTIPNIAASYQDFSGQLPQEAGIDYQLFNWCVLFSQPITAG